MNENLISFLFLYFTNFYTFPPEKWDKRQNSEQKIIKYKAFQFERNAFSMNILQRKVLLFKKFIVKVDVDVIMIYILIKKIFCFIFNNCGLV
jgi:hypothetical protein